MVKIKTTVHVTAEGSDMKQVRKDVISESTPAFVGPGVPKINTSFGRQQYETKGQHDQCQPTIPPGELYKKRKEFFSETIYRNLKEE